MPIIIKQAIQTDNQTVTIDPSKKTPQSELRRQFETLLRALSQLDNQNSVLCVEQSYRQSDRDDLLL